MRSNVLFFAVFILLASACGSGDKKESEEGKEGTTDFVINGKNIELAEKFKYDEEEAKADPNKSYYAKVGEEIVFKAVLGKEDKITEWICPTQNSGEAFSTDDSAKLTFNETGLFEVSLWTEKGEKPVTKYIYVTSGDGSSDNVAAVEKIVDVKSTSSNRPDNPPPTPTPTKAAPEKQPVAKVDPPKKPEATPASKALLADAKTRDNVEPKKATPPPPPPVKATPPPMAKTTPPPAKPIPSAANTVVAKPAPAPEVKKEATKVAPPPAPAAPAAEERMKAYEKVGANTKTKSEEEGAWVEKSTITLTPQKKCKLTETYVYANGSGKVKATLRNNQSGQSASTSSNVNKGKSLITLDELEDITLEPGNTYTLTIEPSSGVKIENAAAQNPAQRESPKLKIDYKGNICVFDLKFKY